LVLDKMPAPVDGELLVETVVSGVCGSDVHAAAGEHRFLPLPYFAGHEVVGIVRGVGQNVIGFSTGDTITVEPTLTCGHCKMCLSGRSNICENLRFFGCGYEQGGMADFFTVPANRSHLIPFGMTTLEAALIEPLATPVHAVRIGGGVEGKSVVIIGAGTIGLLMLAAVRYGGAGRVVVTDVLAAKRERALRLGADFVVDAAGATVVTDVRDAIGESADIVFDCVAIQSTVSQAVGIATRGGTVVVVGVPARPITIDLPVLQETQMRLQGTTTYMHEDFVTAMRIIQSGRIPVADMVTAKFPLARAAEAFAAVASGEQVKVLVSRF
jgi:2-desacetyl-2-hydroxyethyl bacteriochlorophyllide A dehydrogenase